MSEKLQIRQMNWVKMFRKKSLSNELFFIFPSKVQNLTVFSIVCMIRIRFFGPRQLIQRYFRRAQDMPKQIKQEFGFDSKDAVNIGGVSITNHTFAVTDVSGLEASYARGKFDGICGMVPWFLEAKITIKLQQLQFDPSTNANTSEDQWSYDSFATYSEKDFSGVPDFFQFWDTFSVIFSTSRPWPSPSPTAWRISSRVH